MGNSVQEGTSAKIFLFIFFIQKTGFLSNITTFLRVNRKVSAYFLVGILNKKEEKKEEEKKRKKTNAY